MYPLSIGGVEKHVWYLGTQLSEMGHDVTFLSTRTAVQSSETIHRKNILEICRTLRKKNFNILHFHSYGDKPIGLIGNELVILFAKLLGMKIVVTPHASLDTFTLVTRDRKGLFREFLRRFYIVGLRIFFNLFVDCLIALTPKQKELYVKMGFPNHMIFTLPNAIPNKFFSNPPSFNGRDDGKKIFLHVGRLDPQKGIETLIEAFSKLKLEEKNIVLKFVGPDHGLYAQNIKKWANSFGLDDSIQFLGVVDEQTLVELYKTAYVLVLSSWFEGFPTVLLEAAALGCPIIATNSFDTDFLNESALFFKAGDHNELFTNLVFAINDPELLKKNAIGAHRAASKYKWSVVAKRAENLYFRLKNGRK